MPTATKKRPPAKRAAAVKMARPSKAPGAGASPLAFWAGEFGVEYTKRNQVDWQKRVPFFVDILERAEASSFLDVGCNAGWNMLALRSINAKFEMSGVDVNHDALLVAQGHGFDVVNAPADQVVATFQEGAAQMAMTSGVLIHIPTPELEAAMTAIRDVSSHYVLAIEYEAPREEAVIYRGHNDRLWKRPYGELYSSLGLSLVESGVAPGFDACHYWLLEK